MIDIYSAYGALELSLLYLPFGANCSISGNYYYAGCCYGFFIRLRLGTIGVEASLFLGILLVLMMGVLSLLILRFGMVIS